MDIILLLKVTTLNSLLKISQVPAGKTEMGPTIFITDHDQVYYSI